MLKPDKLGKGQTDVHSLNVSLKKKKARMSLGVTAHC